jgi:hypothetical protein
VDGLPTLLIAPCEDFGVDEVDVYIAESATAGASAGASASARPIRRSWTVAESDPLDGRGVDKETGRAGFQVRLLRERSCAE